MTIFPQNATRYICLLHRVGVALAEVYDFSIAVPVVKIDAEPVSFRPDYNVFLQKLVEVLGNSFRYEIEPLTSFNRESTSLAMPFRLYCTDPSVEYLSFAPDSALNDSTVEYSQSSVNSHVLNAKAVEALGYLETAESAHGLHSQGLTGYVGLDTNFDVDPFFYIRLKNVDGFLEPLPQELEALDSYRNVRDRSQSTSPIPWNYSPTSLVAVTVLSPDVPSTIPMVKTFDEKLEQNVIVEVTANRGSILILASEVIGETCIEPSNARYLDMTRMSTDETFVADPAVFPDVFGANSLETMFYRPGLFVSTESFASDAPILLQMRGLEAVNHPMFNEAAPAVYAALNTPVKIQNLIKFGLAKRKLIEGSWDAQVIELPVDVFFYGSRRFANIIYDLGLLTFNSEVVINPPLCLFPPTIPILESRVLVLDAETFERTLSFQRRIGLSTEPMFVFLHLGTFHELSAHPLTGPDYLDLSAEGASGVLTIPANQKAYVSLLGANFYNEFESIVITGYPTIDLTGQPYIFPTPIGPDEDLLFLRDYYENMYFQFTVTDPCQIDLSSSLFGHALQTSLQGNADSTPIELQDLQYYLGDASVVRYTITLPGAYRLNISNRNGLIPSPTNDLCIQVITTPIVSP